MTAFSLPTALAFASMVAFVVTFYYVALSRTLRSARAFDPYVLLAISYGCYGLRVICQFQPLHELVVFAALTDLLYIGWVTALWFGVRSYRGNSSIYWKDLLAPTCLVSWYVFAMALDLPFSWRLIPQHLFGTVLFGLAGIHLWRIENRDAKYWLIGVAVLLWMQGASTASYPFTRMTWYAPYGFFLFATLALAVGMGLMIIALQQEACKLEQAHAKIRLAATAFEAQEGMMITDAEKVIQQVNKAFTAITGYSPDDALGQTPRLLNSGCHSPDFYVAMWESIGRTGTWQGEIWNRHKQGEIYAVSLSISAVKGDNQLVTHYIGMLSDITEQKAANAKIEHLAFYDALTDLPNRQLLNERLRAALAARSRTGKQCALLLIDLDNFKTLNDALGHDVGDLLLKEVAQRLLGCTRGEDTVSRLGGDEFIVLLEGLNEDILQAATQAESVAKKIIAELGQDFSVSTYEHRTSASIGITLLTNANLTVEELLKHADLAMYQAKAGGRNTFRFYDPNMQIAAAQRVELEQSLRKALTGSEFQLYYQPQINDAGMTIGAEALIRWHHPRRGLVPPSEFISTAEATGLIIEIGQWVLMTACAKLAEWSVRPALSDVTLAANVSARQFLQRDFVDQVARALATTGANPARLKLELTEGVFVDDMEDVIEKMQAVRKLGVGFRSMISVPGIHRLLILKSCRSISSRSTRALSMMC